MSKISYLITTIVIMAWTLDGFCDQKVPLTPIEESFFEGTIHVSVRPPAHPGERALAIVTKSDKGSSKTVCTGSLENPVRPSEVYTDRDGHYLVTVDDWTDPGQRHTLVFYSCDSSLKLLKDYTLFDFLKPSEITQDVVQTSSGFAWEQSAELAISNGEFSVKMKSGRKIRFKLESGTYLK